MRKTPEALAELIRDEARAERNANAHREALVKANAARRAKRRKRADDLRLWKKLNLPKHRSGTNPQRQIGKAPGWRVLWERMEPGAWYADEDLVALMPEYAYGSPRAWLHTKLRPKGMVERAASGKLGVVGEVTFLYRKILEK